MTKHGLLWLFAIIAIFLFAPLAMESAEYEACISEEMREASRWYGQEEVQNILDRADLIYSLGMISTGIDPLLRRHFIASTDQELAPGAKLPGAMMPYANRVISYWSGFLRNIWLFCLRAAHALSWMLYLLPFLAGVIFDGLMARKAKLASFRYTSPTVYNVSWHLIIFIVAISMVLFAAVTPLSIFMYPTLITAVGLFVRLVISNIQHSA